MAAPRVMLLLALTSTVASLHVAAPSLRGVVPARSSCPRCVASVEELRAAESRGKLSPKTKSWEAPAQGVAGLRAGPGEIERGIGAGRDLPSPSGINAMPLLQQTFVVLAIFAAVGAGTALLTGPAFGAAKGSFLWNLSRPTWPALGLIYLAAGVAHFTEADGFENITPPNGTWGWWFTPFSPKFNVYWTGVVEIFGGAWMLFGALAPVAGFALPAALGPVVSDAALTLFLLTAIVTPANVYALTHGANFPLNLETPPKAHAVRLGFQPLLLAMMWEMAQPTLLDAQYNLGLL